MKKSFLLFLCFIQLYFYAFNIMVDNYIIVVYNVTNSFRKRIINSYEEFYHYAQSGLYGDYILTPLNDSYRNREQIEDCQMYVDGEKKDFAYIYTFSSEGLHTIKFVFNQLFKSTVDIFKEV